MNDRQKKPVPASDKDLSVRTPDLVRRINCMREQRLRVCAGVSILQPKGRIHLVLLGVWLAVLLTACSSAPAFYNPHVGKWINRDPIGESAQASCLAFVRNRPSGSVDRLGLDEIVVVTTPFPITTMGPDGKPVIDEDSESHLWWLRNRGNPDWIIVTVKDIPSGNRRLQKLPNCDCVKELHLEGHGAFTGQTVCSTKTPVFRESGQIRAELKKLGDPDKLDDYIITGLEFFRGLKFCKPCKIILRGCGSANGDSGKALLKAIANRTGCSAQGFSEETVTGQAGGMSGTHRDKGIGTGPDVVIYPDSTWSPGSWTGDYP